jgi:hypothetical protein
MMLSDDVIFEEVQGYEQSIDDAFVAVSEGRLPDAVEALIAGFKRSNALNRKLIADRGERTVLTLDSIDEFIDRVKREIRDK